MSTTIGGKDVLVVRAGTHEWTDVFMALSPDHLVMTRLDDGRDGIVVRHDDPQVVLVADPRVHKALVSA